MYRRVPCDWFLCDGIFKKVRLDAPMLLTDALADTGVINRDASCMDRLANEWIYRRTWTYSAEFSMQEDSGRTFLKLTNLVGNYNIILNGTDVSESEFEATELIKAENRIEIAFSPDTSFEIKPELGFSGMLMFKKTKAVALDELELNNDGSVRTTVNSAFDGQAVFRYSLSGNETEITEKIGQGKAVFEHKPFDKLENGARNDVVLEVYVKKELSDEISACNYVPKTDAPGRGFVTKNEALIGLSAGANANTVFSGKKDAALNVLAARHGLKSSQLDDLKAVRAPEALNKEDRLSEICGRTELINNPAVWKLTGADKARYDELKNQVSSDDIEAVIALSRCVQALEIKNMALKARIDGRAFAIEAVDKGLDAPASCALMDDARHLRPAFYALKAAWQQSYAFTVLSNEVPEDGIFSADVMYVTDDGQDGFAEIKVTAYDMSGKMINSSSYAATGKLTRVGRFVTEMPENGICMIRTHLTKRDGTGTVSDEMVFDSKTGYKNLNTTQVLIKDDRVVNTGDCIAACVCIPEAGFFGCLLPGEEVMADRADEAEGVNIYL